MITTLDKLPKEYKLSVEVKPTSLPEKRAGVLRFIPGDKAGNYEGQIHMITRLSSGRLHFYTAINGDAKYKISTVTKYKENEWIHIEISQIHEAKGYNYTMIVNGKQEHTVINDQPEEFHQVKCYVAGGGIINQEGFFRNLFVYFKK